MKNFIIDNETMELNEAVQFLVDNFDDETYDNMLDDVYGDIEICGLSYAASIALYRVDEIAYKCGKNDYADSMSGDYQYELENMEDGDTTTICGYDVECTEEEEENE